MNTQGAIEYISDNINTDILTDEELKYFVNDACDTLDWANEELEFGTFGEHYENDINRNRVLEYFMNRRKKNVQRTVNEDKGVN